MGCKRLNRTGARASTRDTIAKLFERGNDRGGQLHRLRICCSATDCGLLCKRLVKGPGRSQVICMDMPMSPGTGPGYANLYAALRDPAFECPEGRF